MHTLIRRYPHVFLMPQLHNMNVIALSLLTRVGVCPSKHQPFAALVTVAAVNGHIELAASVFGAGKKYCNVATYAHSGTPSPSVGVWCLLTVNTPQ